MNDLHTYETVLIINEKNENSREKIDKIGKILTKHGGAITNIEKWGIKKLAYPVEKNNIKYNEGYYITYFFANNPENISELQKELTNQNDVIKFLICDTTDKWND